MCRGTHEPESLCAFRIRHPVFFQAALVLCFVFGAVVPLAVFGTHLVGPSAETVAELGVRLPGHTQMARALRYPCWLVVLLSTVVVFLLGRKAWPEASHSGRTVCLVAALSLIVINASIVALGWPLFH